MAEEHGRYDADPGGGASLRFDLPRSAPVALLRADREDGSFRAVGPSSATLLGLDGPGASVLLDREALTAHLPYDGDWLDVLCAPGDPEDGGRTVTWRRGDGRELLLVARILGGDGERRERLVLLVDGSDGAAQLVDLEDAVAVAGQAERLAKAGSFVWDLARHRLRLSPFLHELMGLSGTARALTHMEDLAPFIVDEDVEGVMSRVDEMVRVGEPRPLSFRIRRPEGEIRHVEVELDFSYGREGRVERCVGILRDVTEGHRSAETGRALEASFASTFEHAGTGMALVDTDGSFLVTNPALCRFLGREEDDLVGRTLAEITHPDEAETCRADFRRLLEGATDHYRQEKRYVRPDGETVHALLTVTMIRSASGDPSHAVAELVDIGDRLHWEARLRSSEARFRALFDYCPLAAATIDPAGGRLIQCNDAWLALHGYDRAEVKDLDVADLLAPEAREESRQVFLDMARRTEPLEEPLDTEVEILRKDGQRRTVRIVSSLVFQGEGSPPVLQSILEDVTERRRSEARNRTMSEKLQEAQKLESLGVLAGGIAHDFNNILMAILGNADLIRIEAPDAHAISESGQAISESAQEIIDAAHRAAGLCRQMLAYSGRGHFFMEPLRLVEVIAGMGELLAVGLPKGVAIHYELDHSLPPIDGDRKQMSQALVSLVTNAAEALAGGDGRIHVRTYVRRFEDEELAEARGQAMPVGGRWVVLEVEDDGCGMDESTRLRAFDPFFTTKFTGRGLGLSALLGIVRGHEGLVLIDSVPGRGTRVRCLFPPGRTEAGEAEGSSPVARADAVLLVDDEDTVRRVARRMLERLGWRVVEARDGKEALAAFDAAPRSWALVLLDLTMPRMDGIECHRLLRLRSRQVPVILSTGYDPSAVSDRFAGSRPDAIIQKPYRLDALREIIRTILEGPGEKG